jgi:hypothetical protein
MQLTGIWGVIRKECPTIMQLTRIWSVIRQEYSRIMQLTRIRGVIRQEDCKMYQPSTQSVIRQEDLDSQLFGE